MCTRDLKSLQRKQGISGRKGLSNELREQYSKKITDIILGLEIYKKAATILSYQPFGAEADTSLLGQAAITDNKRLAYPISEAGGVLVPAIPSGDDRWSVGKFNFSSPIKEKSLILSPLEIDLIIVPCTAFCGISRMRIGMGAGYYDRFLPQCSNALTIAVAFEAQRIDNLHYDAWDVPLSAIITEFAVYGDIICRIAEHYW